MTVNYDGDSVTGLLSALAGLRYADLRERDYHAAHAVVLREHGGAVSARWDRLMEDRFVAAAHERGTEFTQVDGDWTAQHGDKEGAGETAYDALLALRELMR